VERRVEDYAQALPLARPMIPPHLGFADLRTPDIQPPDLVTGACGAARGIEAGSGANPRLTGLGKVLPTTQDQPRMTGMTPSRLPRCDQNHCHSCHSISIRNTPR
jgi:hypothetical protein